MDKVYITHTCKNGKLDSGHKDYCNNAFIDVDKTNCQTTPPTWKFCPECVAKGFTNPKTRSCQKTPEQIQAFKERMAKHRASKVS